MWKSAVLAVLPSALRISEIAPAIRPECIQRAIAEQAVEITFINALVARKVLACAVREERCSERGMVAASAALSKPVGFKPIGSLEDLRNAADHTHNRIHPLCEILRESTHSVAPITFPAGNRYDAAADLLAQDDLLGCREGIDKRRCIRVFRTHQLLCIEKHRATGRKLFAHVGVGKTERTSVCALARSDSSNHEYHRTTTFEITTSATIIASSATWRKKPARSPLMPPNCDCAKG